MENAKYDELKNCLSHHLELYGKLAFLLDEEKEALLVMNLDKIQEASEAKNLLAKDLQESLQHTMGLIGLIAHELGLPSDPMPSLAQLGEKVSEPYKSVLNKSAYRLNRIKTVINAAHLTNQAFIQEALGLVNGSINILTGASQLKGSGYGPQGQDHQRSHTQPVKLSRDV